MREGSAQQGSINTLAWNRMSSAPMETVHSVGDRLDQCDDVEEIASQYGDSLRSVLHNARSVGEQLDQCQAVQDSNPFSTSPQKDSNPFSTSPQSKYHVQTESPSSPAQSYDCCAYSDQERRVDFQVYTPQMRPMPNGSITVVSPSGDRSSISTLETPKKLLSPQGSPPGGSLVLPPGGSLLSPPGGSLCPEDLRSGEIWQKDGVQCFLCDGKFKPVMNPRHHCRVCFKCVCNACTPNRLVLSGFQGLQRVCSPCVSSGAGALSILPRLQQLGEELLRLNPNSSSVPSQPTMCNNASQALDNCMTAMEPIRDLKNQVATATSQAGRFKSELTAAAERATCAEVNTERSRLRLAAMESQLRDERALRSETERKLQTESDNAERERVARVKAEKKAEEAERKAGLNSLQKAEQQLRQKTEQMQHHRKQMDQAAGSLTKLDRLLQNIEKNSAEAMPGPDSANNGFFKNPLSRGRSTSQNRVKSSDRRKSEANTRGEPNSPKFGGQEGDGPSARNVLFESALAACLETAARLSGEISQEGNRQLNGTVEPYVESPYDKGRERALSSSSMPQVSVMSEYASREARAHQQRRDEGQQQRGRGEQDEPDSPRAERQQSLGSRRLPGAGDREPEPDSFAYGNATASWMPSASWMPGANASDKMSWDDDSRNCTVCNCLLGKRYLRMRHHCRICGRCVCSKCSPKSIVLAHMEGPQRACTPCVQLADAQVAAARSSPDVFCDSYDLRTDMPIEEAHDCEDSALAEKFGLSPQV